MDIEVKTDSELMVAHIEAQTDEGQEFVDAYTVEDLIVIDSGRIIIPTEKLQEFGESAIIVGITLNVEVTR